MTFMIKMTMMIAGADTELRCFLPTGDGALIAEAQCTHPYTNELTWRPVLELTGCEDSFRASVIRRLCELMAETTDAPKSFRLSEENGLRVLDIGHCRWIMRP